MDPTGVDAGCLIGAAMVWGRDGDTVLKADGDPFSSYMAGLRSGGWSGDEEHVRRAFFGQFGNYLLATGTALTHVLDSTERAEQLRDFMEKRFQTPFDEIPDLLAPVVDSYPYYIEEISRLLD
jgi:hypothetical protein